MLTATRIQEITAKLRSVVDEINAGMAELSDEELLEVMAAYEAAGRDLSALQVRVAGEVEVRSRSELRNEG